ncbi:MAG: Ig-like domain repeat protein, partial [Actinomycetota bacterium]|nr:Ig-like domain repeat protein [Actinomycetota bacterium]
RKVALRTLQASVTTEIHNPSHQDITKTTVTKGLVVHDKAIVTPKEPGGPVPTGKVRFRRYTNAGCFGQPAAQEYVTLVNGMAESSTHVVTGNMSYKVRYIGDYNYRYQGSGCEKLFARDPFTPTVTTEVHDANHNDITGQNVLFGTVVHDEATVAGTGPTPTGTVDFARFANASCSGNPVSTESDVPLSGGVAESSPHTVTGDISYLVHYDGDADNNPADGVCEPLFLGQKATSTTTTEVHNALHQDITGATVPAGTVVHDEATVTGSGPTPTGTVDFARFTNATCSGSPAAVESDVSLVNGVAESSPFVTSQGGMSYLVHYDGDVNYDPSNGPCEPLNVQQLGAQGCTPGYWKQDQHFDSWTGVTPSSSFEAIFGRPTAFPGNPSMLTVLRFDGAGLQALGRHAAAALLNANSPGVDYPFLSSEVIQMFQAAFDSGDPVLIEITKNEFDAASNALCLLN